jgi:(p)ppGpp synthase/HD superfamily hydrolase
MIYTPLTQKAMHIAYQAHHGQFDKSGTPYIFHPIHLAETMDDEYSCCVALLHDTVEDTDVTLEDLKQVFPPEVTDAVALLTHDDSVDYFDYVRAIKHNPIARKVKLADLAHNSDQSRCVGSGISEEKLQRLKAKYEKATKILSEN